MGGRYVRCEDVLNTKEPDLYSSPPSQPEGDEQKGEADEMLKRFGILLTIAKSAIKSTRQPAINEMRKMLDQIENEVPPLHPAITHINADQPMSKETVEAINKMADIAYDSKARNEGTISEKLKNIWSSPAPPAVGEEDLKAEEKLANALTETGLSLAAIMKLSTAIDEYAASRASQMKEWPTKQESELERVRIAQTEVWLDGRDEVGAYRQGWDKCFIWLQSRIEQIKTLNPSNQEGR